MAPSHEGKEERVKRKHWKRTGSMVRDRKLNKRKREEDGGVKSQREPKEIEDKERHLE